MIGIALLFQHKRKARGKGYRRYEMSRLLEAYNSVMETGVPIKRAAKLFNVPVSTLRDRVNNKVSIDVTKTGPSPVLNREEETKLTSHLIQLAKIGYGYTQVEVTRQASDFAIELGRRDATKPFSTKWYINYVARYSEENRVKTFTLPQQKRLCKREECISTYYNNLNSIAKEYKFTEAPERMYLIYNMEVDIPAGEKCNNTLTVIGAGNAAGQNIPPYFVLVTGFSEENDHYFVRRSHLLRQGFETYFQSHFAKYASGKDEKEQILVLYDAHRVHFSVEMIEWAKRSQIVIFPIPPHTSHICKTSINTVFQQIETKFSQEYGDVAPYKHLTSATGVVDILKDIYESSVTPLALKESFSKSGIYPLQESKVMCDFLKKEGIIS